MDFSCSRHGARQEPGAAGNALDPKDSGITQAFRETSINPREFQSPIGL